MDFNFRLPINVISGEGCIMKNSHAIKPLGKKCIIVTGGKSAKVSGALEDMEQALAQEGISYCIYDKIGQNPRIDHCHEAGAIAREFGADFVVGIGGGSPLDAAKAVAVYAANDSMSTTDIYALTQKERNTALPILLVGTTAGTGSEVGRVSVLTNPETGRKKSISPDDTYPALTFADPTYTHSMPYDVTVSTALDAMSHAVEGYLSVKCTDIPTMFGETAVKFLWEGLKALYADKSCPDKKIREKLYYGSLYAGITLAYCGTAFPHPLGYILTENYGIPHGRACTAFMGELLARAKSHCPDKLRRLLLVMGTDYAEFAAVIEELTDVKAMGIAMTQEEITCYCERFDTPPANFRFSPGEYGKSEAVAVFRQKFLK